jgi:hypothetical protein
MHVTEKVHVMGLPKPGMVFLACRGQQADRVSSAFGLKGSAARRGQHSRQAELTRQLHICLTLLMLDDTTCSCALSFGAVDD